MNTKHRTSGTQLRQCFRMEAVAAKAFINKEERFQTNNLNLHVKILEKEEAKHKGHKYQSGS